MRHSLLQDTSLLVLTAPMLANKGCEVKPTYNETIPERPAIAAEQCHCRKRAHLRREEAIAQTACCQTKPFLQGEDFRKLSEPTTLLTQTDHYYNYCRLAVIFSTYHRTTSPQPPMPQISCADQAHPPNFVTSGGERPRCMVTIFRRSR